MPDDVIAWDPTRPYTRATPNFWNEGCPDGYFAQFVAKDLGGYDYGNPLTNVRCRAVATTTPETIVDESGTTWTESIDGFNAAVTDTLSQVSHDVLGGLGASIPWVLLAVVGYLALSGSPRAQSVRVYAGAAKRGVAAARSHVKQRRR